MPQVTPSGCRVRPRGGESARVTTFELFFDLVYVFAFTQVSGLMADTHSALGVLQALVVLGLLWWMWCSYSWLGNQAPADRGVVQAGMGLAMIAVFIVALAIPEAYDDLPGGWYAPLVVALAYLFVRIVHATLYVIVAGEDRALRRQVLGTQVVALVPSATALIVGALIGGAAQTWIWLARLRLGRHLHLRELARRRRLATALARALGGAVRAHRDPGARRVDRRDRGRRRTGADRRADRARRHPLGDPLDPPVACVLHAHRARRRARAAAAHGRRTGRVRPRRVHVPALRRSSAA